MGQNDCACLGKQNGDLKDVCQQLAYRQFELAYKVKFFDFEDINEANQASVSGKVIMPVLIIDKNYKPGE